MKFIYMTFILVFLSTSTYAKQKCITVQDGTTIECYEYNKDKNGNLIKNGKFSTFYKDGGIQKSGTYLNDRLDGIVEWYSKNSNLIARCTYRDNFPYSGVCLKTDFISYKNDILYQGYILSNYYNFKLDGESEKFDKHNKLTAVSTYEMDKLVNQKKWLNKNNNKINFLDNGIKQGKWEYRNKDGLLLSKKEYKDGLLNGLSIEYGMFQRVIKKQSYQNGKKIFKEKKKKILDAKYTIQIGSYRKTNQNVYKYIDKLQKLNIYTYTKYTKNKIELYSGRFIEFKDAKKRLKQIKKVVKDAYIKGL